MRISWRMTSCAAMLVVAVSWATLPAAPLPPPADRTSRPPAADQRIDFRRDVYPILAQRCFECHLGPQASSGRRLDRRRSLVDAEEGGPLVLVGDGAGSRLVRLVAGLDPQRRMPPEGDPLSEREVGLLRAWIDQGLEWDEELLGEEHWSFRPPLRPRIPDLRGSPETGTGSRMLREPRSFGTIDGVPVPVSGEPLNRAAWGRNPVDAFIGHDHEELGLAPAPEAPRSVLIRRLTLDLVGLPPTPAEVARFQADGSPDAYERLVDRLLASPHHGERWGRHWLDVARWAESEGYESNHPRAFAWRYRDYVVDSFNEDVPYSRFLAEQIAGDELRPCSDRNLVATGFLAAARLSSNEEDKWRQRNDVLVDMANTTAAAFLGLTLGCAQCHDHKFDPVSQRDYYRFQGFFLRGQPANVAIRDPRWWRAYDRSKPAEYDLARGLRDLLYERGRAIQRKEALGRLSPEELRAVGIRSDQRTDDEEKLARRADLRLQQTPNGIERAIPAPDRRLYEELKRTVAELEKTMPPVPQTWAFYSPITSPHSVEVLPMLGFYPLPYEPDELGRLVPRLLVRGEVNDLGPRLEVGWPECFGPTPAQIARDATRLRLAEWLTDAGHPLVPRVWVNRLWHYHFGRGLVATPGNFGLRGAPPSHPRLLDWLAIELVRTGWSTKAMHRLLVQSATYRQSARSDAHRASDPENVFLCRWRPRRLEAEAIRDTLLAASGELDRTIGGPSVPRSQEREDGRRALYLVQERDGPPALQGLFDGPSGATESCHGRLVSTSPLQALYLLGDPFVLRCGQGLCDRLAREGFDTGKVPDPADLAEDGVERAFLYALGRPPAAEERVLSIEYLRFSSGHIEPTGAWLQFCQALLNANELVYID